MGPRRGIDAGDGGIKGRLAIIVTGRQAQREGQIERADEQRIDAWHRGNLLDNRQRFHRLDHRDDGDAGVGTRHIAHAVARPHTHRPQAAAAGGRVETGFDKPLRLGHAVHHRRHDAHGAGIQHAANDAGLVPRHPHDRGDAGQIDGADHFHRRFIAHAAVLHVDQRPIKAGLGEDLGGQAAGQHAPGAQRQLITLPALLERFNHDGNSPR